MIESGPCVLTRDPWQVSVGLLHSFTYKLTNNTLHHLTFYWCSPKSNSLNVPPWSFSASLILIPPQMASRWMMSMTRPRRLVSTGSSKSPPSENFCPDCILHERRGQPASSLTLTGHGGDFRCVLNSDVREQIRGGSHSEVQPLPEQNVSTSAQTDFILRKYVKLRNGRRPFADLWLSFLPPPLQWYPGDASPPHSHDQGHRRPSGGGVRQSLPLQGEDTPPPPPVLNPSFLSFPASSLLSLKP